MLILAMLIFAGLFLPVYFCRLIFGGLFLPVYFCRFIFAGLFLAVYCCRFIFCRFSSCPWTICACLVHVHKYSGISQHADAEESLKFCDGEMVRVKH